MISVIPFSAFIRSSTGINRQGYTQGVPLTTAYIKRSKLGSELVIPFSMRDRPFRVNSFSNVFHDTILHDVPATIILPESWVLSCKVNAVEMSLCISNSPSPMVQIRAIPSSEISVAINGKPCSKTVLESLPSPHPISRSFCPRWILYRSITSITIGVLTSLDQLTPFAWAVL